MGGQWIRADTSEICERCGGEIESGTQMFVVGDDVYDEGCGGLLDED